MVTFSPRLRLLLRVEVAKNWICCLEEYPVVEIISGLYLIFVLGLKTSDLQ